LSYLRECLRLIPTGGRPGAAGLAVCPQYRDAAFTEAVTGEVDGFSQAGHRQARRFVTGQVAANGSAAQAFTLENTSGG
jgi:hypothetical protein